MTKRNESVVIGFARTAVLELLGAILFLSFIATIGSLVPVLRWLSHV